MRGLPALLSSDLGPLATVAQVFWILQLALVIHVYRTGRPYWWTWILFSAPMIGGIAYFIIEIAPELRGAGGAQHGLLYALKPRKWRIADLRSELEESDTVENRLALAEELSAGNLRNEAHEVAADCLRGVFRDDPHTLVDVARYEVGAARIDEALALLERVNTKADRMLELQVCLLTGDILCGLGRYDEAEKFYRSIAGKYIGEAPRFGLATVMEQSGRPDEATAIWKEIRVKFRKASPAWRRTEKKWYKLATAKLKSQKV
jgi:hypothetical protein